MRDRPWVARSLVESWNTATDEHKADRLRYGPWTVASTIAAFQSLELTVPDELLELHERVTR